MGGGGGGRRAAPGWRRYYRRRAVRILPAYWLALLAVLLLAPHDGGRPRTSWRNTTLTQMYGGGHLLADFTQTWSLCTEVLFYLAAAARGRRRSAGWRGRPPGWGCSRP